MTKYPVYILSKGRANKCLTANFLLADGVDFKIAVEPQEYDLYVNEYGGDKVIATNFSNLNQGAQSARNFIRDHSRSLGHEFHWQLDDNIKCVKKYLNGKGIRHNSLDAFVEIEQFVDRYENIGIAGMTNTAFAFSKTKPIAINNQVYCCILFRNDLPVRWRIPYGEDVDMTLQCLANNFATVNFNYLAIEKLTSGVIKGGNTERYQNDGRLKVVAHLERLWPHIMKSTRKWGRPTHDIGHVWKKFDIPLIRKQNAT